MIDLTKKVLPESVLVDGRTYKIKTDFQYWLNFGFKLQKEEIYSAYDFDYLWVSDKPKDMNKAFTALIDFYSPKKELPHHIGSNNSDRVIIDFRKDADYIFAAFYEQYHLDLIDKDLHLHWYKFNALFDALHDTKINEIMQARGYDPTDKSTYEQSMQRMQRAWEITKPLTKEEQAELDAFDALLK